MQARRPHGVKPEKETETSVSRCGRERGIDYQDGWWLVRKLLLVTEDKNGSMMHSAVDVGCIALLLLSCWATTFLECAGKLSHYFTNRGAPATKRARQT
jgi:hypothetical protein